MRRECEFICDGCGSNKATEDEFCKNTFLCKAIGDQPFPYLVILSSGHEIECQGIEVRAAGWVRLLRSLDHYGRLSENTYIGKYDLPCPRGIDVRIDSIIAIADAPRTS